MLQNTLKNLYQGCARRSQKVVPQLLVSGQWSVGDVGGPESNDILRTHPGADN